MLGISLTYGAGGLDEKPNILIIIPDDLGWSDVGYHGSEIKTPNIDLLAKTGIKLEQHYVMPTCTPTRVSLMTGKYPSRYGVTAPDYGEVIDLGDPTLASILSKNGYYTALVGKWHMGSPPYTPMKYGFKSTYGYFDGQIDPYTHEYKTGRKCWHRNDKLFDEEGHVTDLLTAEAIRVIEEDRDEPFFLYVAQQVPHSPLNEPEEWTSVYDELSLYPTRKLFAASVTHMDDGIGKIIEALDRTGKREQTIILVLSDNGGQHSWQSDTEYHGAYANQPHLVLGNNFPLRGWKGDVYEGGIRTPAIINWKGTLSPGVINSPLHMSDWLPTLCNLIGIEKELNKLKLDGKNIWPVVSGEKETLDEHPIYWKTNQAYAVRDGDWKLIYHRNSKTSELYNLKEDFREDHDVSKFNPEKVKVLLAMMEAYKSGDRE
ncbi:MAG: sulfatase-like hydrolase/transferase [Bacteroidota bacterium]